MNKSKNGDVEMVYAVAVGVEIELKPGWFQQFETFPAQV